jgi:hypothetical protein
MNQNLSQSQFNPKLNSMTKMGAMPRNPEFTDPQPLKISSFDNAYAPGADKQIAKPGFF